MFLHLNSIYKQSCRRIKTLKSFALNRGLTCWSFMYTHSKHFTRSFKVSVCVKDMSSISFIQRLNPINNKMEWKAVHDDYDYNQEIATSCYGDMLHDDERNKKFGKALQKAIKKLHNSGKKAHVLDIGTGTGLLSMLAVQYGADSVVACEAFLPMANCALNILKENNFSSKIKIVKCHSTSLTVGQKGDLKQKANILVSEVFDTELIGEGAIKTFNHAFEHLLEEDCIVIPSSATVYAQVVESDLAQKWNKLEDWKSGEEVLINIPGEIKNCHGAGAVHDIQLSEFDRKHFKVLSEVIPIFRFDWAKNKKIPTHNQKKSHSKCILSGKAQVVFMWWDLRMDEDGEIIISCAPFWEHPYVKGKSLGKDNKSLTKSLPWRDHWMQAVYFFTKETPLNKNETFTLVSNHDEFSFWFEIADSGKILEVERPVCTCAFHFLLSRTRIGALNDNMRRQSYFNALNKVINKNTLCIVVNGITLLGVLCAKLGAKKVYILSESSSVEKVCTMLGVENKVMDIVSVISNVSNIMEEVCKERPDDVLIVSEPYFRNSILPWDNLALWFMKEEIVKGIKNAEEIKSIRTFPQKCKLKCCAIQFDNLWKIAIPLKLCEGFSMKMFDDLIVTAKEKTGNYVEAQPLWEYPGIALTKTSTVFEFDFNEEIPKARVQRNGILEFDCHGRCDGVALWMEYYLADDVALCFGPVKEIVVNEYISWDMFERQGVHLFRNQRMVNPGDGIYYKADFDPQEADFNFNFCFDKTTISIKK